MPPDPNKPLNPWHPDKNEINVALMGKTLEELGELGGIVARCLIQGIEEKDPDTDTPNRESLANEIGDVLGMIELLAKRLRVDASKVEYARRLKIDHVSRWMGYLG